MTWLSSLPHEIPFRAASKLIRRDETTIEGAFLCTANDQLPAELMLVEAMAQFGGGLVFGEAKTPGFFSGMDHVEVARAIEPGEVVHITVKLEMSFGGTFRFSGSGQVDGVEVIRGRFYLAHAQA